MVARKQPLTMTLIWVLARTVGPAFRGFRAAREHDLTDLTSHILRGEPEYFAVGDGVLASHLVVRLFDYDALCGIPVTSAGQGGLGDVGCRKCLRLYRKAEKRAGETL